MVMPNEAPDQFFPNQSLNEFPAKKPAWLVIGRIVGAHGLNGHVKVYPESDFPERFTRPGDRWLKKPHSELTPIRITSGRFLDGKNQYLVKLEGIDHRDQAEDLRAAELLVPSSDRLRLNPGEFHVSDLIGLSVYLQADQTLLGTVTDLFTMGHDMLEVTLAAQPVEQIDQITQIEQVTPSPEPTEPAETTPEIALTQDIAHPSMRAKAAGKLKRQAKRKNKSKAPKTLLIPFVEAIVPVVDISTGRIEITPPPGLVDL